MDRRALIRLRAGFVALGLVLLLPLFSLLREAGARLEEQRRLRHEIVAERIFDEMERELTALLEAERARPSSAYDAAHTQAASWAPFVVGYFTRAPRELRLIAREQLPPGRAERVERAVEAFWQSGARPPLAGAAQDALAEEAEREQAEPSKSKAAGPALKQDAKEEAVLRQLNRGAAERLEKKARSRTKREDEGGDPLRGF